MDRGSGLELAIVVLQVHLLAKAAVSLPEVGGLGFQSPAAALEEVVRSPAFSISC